MKKQNTNNLLCRRGKTQEYWQFGLWTSDSLKYCVRHNFIGRWSGHDMICCPFSTNTWWLYLAHCQLTFRVSGPSSIMYEAGQQKLLQSAAVLRFSRFLYSRSSTPLLTHIRNYRNKKPAWVSYGICWDVDFYFLHWYLILANDLGRFYIWTTVTQKWLKTLYNRLLSKRFTVVLVRTFLRSCGYGYLLCRQEFMYLLIWQLTDIVPKSDPGNELER